MEALRVAQQLKDLATDPQNRRTIVRVRSARVADSLRRAWRLSYQFLQLAVLALINKCFTAANRIVLVLIGHVL